MMGINADLSDQNRGSGMRKLSDIDSSEELFVTAYTQVGILTKPTVGLKVNEFVIKDDYAGHFLFFLENNNTDICFEVEQDLQSLCDKNGKPLLTALINIDLSIRFTKDAILLSGAFGKEDIATMFSDLTEYLSDAKKNGSNVVAFQGYRLLA